MSTDQKTIIIILGPTASGKTLLAIELAQYLQTSIISADSRQCFRELNIGVAKPSVRELERVHHYFINSHSVTEDVTAHVFEEYALQSAETIFKHNRFAVMAGGTGLYIKTFCEGLDLIPEVDLTIRKTISERYKIYGLQWLQQELFKKDPAFWAVAERQNPQRLMRALEVLLSTGQSITAFRQSKTKQRPFNIIKLGIEISKEQLHKNIDQRLDAMIREGLAEEVAGLRPYEQLNALQTVGYKELFDSMHKKITQEEAYNKIRQHTKQYAKRQMTWFSKDRSIRWLQKEDTGKLHDIILSLLHN